MNVVSEWKHVSVRPRNPMGCIVHGLGFLTDNVSSIIGINENGVFQSVTMTMMLYRNREREKAAVVGFLTSYQKVCRAFIGLHADIFY